MKSQVSIVRCEGYEQNLVLERVRKSLDLLGGIGRFIKPESRVLLKPNLLMAKEPESGVTTHPQVVRAVINLLKEINCRIFVGDGPSVWGRYVENVDEVYERSGIKRLCEEEGVDLVRFNQRRWRGKFPLTAWLDNCDYLVNIPKFKTHGLTVLTGGIKNLFGLVPGTYKTELHKNYYDKDEFARILVDIYNEAKPGLTIVDGVIVMEGDGPGTSGTLRNLGLVFCGDDCVAIDSILAYIMGIKPEDVPTTKEAAKRLLGISDINSIEIRGEKLEDIKESPFVLPRTDVSLSRKFPAFLVKFVTRFVRYKPKMIHRRCILCGACVGVCPGKAISITDGRTVVDYRKCISCFCCQESCPVKAIETKKSLLARIIGL